MPRARTGSRALQPLQESLRSFAQAVDYPPNQVFIGNLPPERLVEIPRPWFGVTDSPSTETGAFGEIVDQDTFYAVLKQADTLEPPLFEITEESVDRFRNSLLRRSLLGGNEQEVKSASTADIRQELTVPFALPIYSRAASQLGRLTRRFQRRASRRRPSTSFQKDPGYVLTLA